MSSTNYEMVKEFYDKRYWSKGMLKNAVVKLWITADEYKTITNEEYAI